MDRARGSPASHADPSRGPPKRIKTLSATAPSALTQTVRGFHTQARVIGALILRELHSRYGRENIGYLWVIGEPMILASVITLIHLNQPTHFASDIEPAPFAILGYTIFIIFRNTFNRADGAVEQSQPLLYHRMVNVFDILFSRMLMEILGCYATTVVLLGLAVALGYASLPVRPLYLITAALLMGWWTFGLTLIAASVTYRSETIGRQLHVISYFSIPISGAFFQLSWLPPPVRDKMAWFPMPLIFEQARYGQFRSASDEYVDPAYVAAWCAGFTYLGLLLARRMREKIHG